MPRLLPLGPYEESYLRKPRRLRQGPGCEDYRRIRRYPLDAQGSDTLSRMQNVAWHRRFREGGESVKDHVRSGRSWISNPVETIEKFYAVVHRVKSASQAENGFEKCSVDLYKRWQKCDVTQGSNFEFGYVSET
ncbi:hypothetical protein TNCV_1991681 [Trichonephila clavipes]|nr:hypothetical protein TNCV_1991681 [Trichonephila clavipes]